MQSSAGAHLNSHNSSPALDGGGNGGGSGVIDDDDSSLDAFRRRAVSEVVRQSSGRWRLVTAFTSLRKSWEKTTSQSPSDATIGGSDMDDSCESFNALSSEQRKRMSVGAIDTGSNTSQLKPRRRVSLFLRRRGRFRDGNTPHSAYVPPISEAVTTEEEVQQQQHFRRAQSHFEKPVSYNDGESGPVRGGEGGRYLAYAAEFDHVDFEKKRNALRKLRPAAIRLTANTASTSTEVPKTTDGKPPSKADNSGSVKDLAELFGGMKTEDGEIVGEICLEDFADEDGSEDFDFLDGQIVDVCDGGSLRLDGQQINIFGEEEFAAFCKEVGLHQLLEPPKPSEEEWKTFQVGDQVFGQWRDDARIHNRFVASWKDEALVPPEDVRALSKCAK